MNVVILIIGLGLIVMQYTLVFVMSDMIRKLNFRCSKH